MCYLRSSSTVPCKVKMRYSAMVHSRAEADDDARPSKDQDPNRNADVIVHLQGTGAAQCNGTLGLRNWQQASGCALANWNRGPFVGDQGCGGRGQPVADASDSRVKS